MSRKTANDPRRLYVRKGIVHVLFNANTFAMPDDSDIDTDEEVLVTSTRSYAGKPRVKVAQEVEGILVTETWRAVEIPRGAPRPRKNLTEVTAPEAPAPEVSL